MLTCKHLSNAELLGEFPNNTSCLHSFSSFLPGLTQQPFCHCIKSCLLLRALQQLMVGAGEDL